MNVTGTITIIRMRNIGAVSSRYSWSRADLKKKKLKKINEKTVSIRTVDCSAWNDSDALHICNQKFLS